MLNFLTINRNIMKKLILLLFTGMIISCSSSSEGNGSEVDVTKLTAIWHLQSATFNGGDVTSSSADIVKYYTGTSVTYTYTGQGTGGTDLNDNGDYTVSGNTITVHWDDADTGNEITTFTILELTANKMRLRSIADGGTLIENYTR